MTGKTGAARIALMTGCPVIPIANWGAQEVFRVVRQTCGSGCCRARRCG